MKTFITITIFLLTFSACTKTADYSYLNTDRRPMVIRVSERYDNPPDRNPDGSWRFHKFVADTLHRDTRAEDYKNIIPDTTISTCSIDKIDSSFKIQILKYIIR